MVTKELYVPSPEEMHLAQDGIVQYASGVAFLHAPFHTMQFHRYDPIDSKEEIVNHAASLMLNGLKAAIKYSLKEEYRSPMNVSKEHYKDALPNLIAMREGAYVDETSAHKRIDHYFPMIGLMRPFPIVDESIYKRFCHGHFRSNKLPLSQMMAGVGVDPVLKRLV